MTIERVTRGSALWAELAAYAEGCSWVAGPHLARLLREDRFQDWETAFAAVEDGQIAGYCTVMKTDYYPDNRYWPWISSIFVGEAHRGRRLSGRLIDAAIEYARAQGFDKAYIPSDLTGLYEKYGFRRIDELTNYGGDVDHVYMKEI